MRFSWVWKTVTVFLQSQYLVFIQQNLVKSGAALLTQFPLIHLVMAFKNIVWMHKIQTVCASFLTLGHITYFMQIPILDNFKNTCLVKK